MKKSLPVSKEMLNAFVDDELDGDEREWMMTKEARDPDVAREIAELRSLKNLVRAARPEVSCPVANMVVRKKGWRRIRYVAASFLLLAPILAVLLSSMNERSGMQFNVNSTYRNEAELISASQLQSEFKLVLHLKSDDANSVSQTLRILEDVLSMATAGYVSPHIEFVISGPGLNLLKKNSGENIRKVRNILQQYSNVTFIVCGKTLQQFVKQAPSEIQLMEEAMLVTSGPQWAKQRRKQGWSYVLI